MSGWHAALCFPHSTDCTMSNDPQKSPCLPNGFRVGHWSDPEARTGCTVILCPPQTVGGCDVRGGAPGSRELALLDSDRSMQEVHAVLLTGGSAFGLAAAEGVMRFLEERKIGYQTPWAKVPIVPAAVIFDLGEGRSDVRPDPASGYASCMAAKATVEAQGSVGAGTGATVGKWAGMEYRVKGGLGVATIAWDDVVVTAIAVVNALGDVVEENGTILAGARRATGEHLADASGFAEYARVASGRGALQNTTLVALLTNGVLSKLDANKLAQRAHDGMARAIKPVHTSFDGDLVFGLASGNARVPFDILAEAGAEATARAIRSAVISHR
jgi:L-aminopeptidase/D-esterase-like protein